MIYRLCMLLLSKNITVSTAESCTGGGISSRLVTYPGISEVFLGGIVAYGNQAKEQLLGVSAEVLDHYGAVSEECAKAMACGARKCTGSMVSVSSTGFAGPGGGSETAPVGTVYIGVSAKQSTYVRRFLFTGSRAEITGQAVEQAIRFLLETAEKY